MEIRFAIVLFTLLIAIEIVGRCTAQMTVDDEQGSGSGDSDDPDEFRRIINVRATQCKQGEVPDINGVCRYRFWR